MTQEPLKKIEMAGRTCYKSENKITEDSAESFVKMLVTRGHDAMIEHASISYKIICDRGVTHELVRHRHFSFAQESTRYVNYKGKDMEFIQPCFLNVDSVEAEYWKDSLYGCEHAYKRMISCGCKPQEARSVLPNSLKTEIVVTGNLREWKHFFKLRCAKTAHPQMQEIANMLLEDIRKRVNVIFK